MTGFVADEQSRAAELPPPTDWREREKGRGLEHSFIVQAPAGSGKTELLTQRMLGLLARVEDPEEVVAITFTRKAAAEMAYRLVSRLQAAAEAQTGSNDYDSLEAHEQVSRELALAALKNDAGRGWNLLEQPSRLRIRTIDSLCSELSRQLPLLSGLGGGQQIAIDSDALYRQAASYTMSAIEDDSDPLKADIVRVLDRYDNQYDRLVSLLTGMLANREQWLGHLLESRKGDGFDRQGLEDALRYLVEIQLEKARLATPDDLLIELPRFYNYAIGNDAKNKVELTELLKVCGGADCESLDLPATADNLTHWQTMIDSLLTKAGDMRKAAPNKNDGFPAPSSANGEQKVLFAAMKNDFTALLDRHRDDDQLRDIYNTVLTLPSPVYEDEAWESLESLLRILLQAAQNWRLVMAESGEVDFGEITARAIQALGAEDAPSELALRMDYRIQHLLVDEFQDTSASQIRLLNQLTAGWSDGDGRTLFLVGDPMQSIYRFRKAEVSLFIKAWQGTLFDHIRLEPIQLKVNFRSTWPIVDWVNNTFPQVMPWENDSVMGAVCYSDACVKPGVSDKGCVEIKILPERDDEEEARQIADLVARCDQDETLAVLVRSRTHASTILTEFDRRKLEEPRFRYQAINFTPLADTTLIKDLVSLTLALTQPADRLAWLSSLRAPFIGLDLADLDDLVAGDAGNILLDAIAVFAAADDSGQGAQVRLSTDGQQRLQRTAPILKHAVDHRGRQSVRSLVESAWVDLGGPACVDNDSELDDATTYFDLLDALDDQNLPIDQDTLKLRMQNLYAEPDATANGNLQVLTIFAAKGLQFDTVILPGLNREPRGDDAKLLHWFELAGEERIVMSPMRNNDEKEKHKKTGNLIQYITTIENQRQRLEDGRLLYVASTRAVHSLYVFAAIKPTSKDVIKPHSSALLAGLWPAIEMEQTQLIEAAVQTMPDQTEVGEAQDEDGIEDGGEDEGEDDTEKSPALNLPLIYRRLTAGWQAPEAPASVQLSKTELAETQSYIEFSWAGEDARLAGNLVHRLLQLAGEQGLESWEINGGFNVQTNWCRQQLLNEGVQSEKANNIITAVNEAVSNCLASKQGRWILATHEDAHCEYAITAVLDGRPRNLVLDRTFIDNGTRWIIDYKTSSHSGGNLEGFLESEANRYREQLNRYKAAMALTETHPIKTALYFPLLDRLLEVN